MKNAAFWITMDIDSLKEKMLIDQYNFFFKLLLFVAFLACLNIAYDIFHDPLYCRKILKTIKLNFFQNFALFVASLIISKYYVTTAEPASL